ncbi:hypothetical protein BS47DRAFT_416719 [Hydnum rufescens UP504]|uniref:Uncharacterized protein n=1 Tax=Hydnum rufescens UP504 TaxID=1448309 RepID=A0A9P6BAV7_9AGAM|nr:hypothetical protein BS47DRAFT_416719 [Hydnum rufescens UP504]
MWQTQMILSNCNINHCSPVPSFYLVLKYAGSKACTPFLKLLHPQSIPSNKNVQYLVFICLVILWTRGERNADLPTARSIQDQIKDDGGFPGATSFYITRKLAKLIDEYTAL